MFYIMYIYDNVRQYDYDKADCKTIIHFVSEKEKAINIANR